VLSSAAGRPNLRLFLAGPLPDEVQAALFSALAAARRAASQARWVRPGQLHLTLAFFGETEASQLPSLVDALRAVAPRHPAAMLGLKGAGCFGRRHQPNVLFAELAGEVDALRALEADVRGILGPLRGEEAAGPAFRPHLTLARARSRQGDMALSRCRRALQGQPLGAFVLDRMVLYQSQLLPGGAVYTPLLELPLGSAASAHP
jgi:RNA 2',3'-cyclic 3'-phosphodiesterase